MTVCCSAMVDWVVEQGTEMFKRTTAEGSWATNGDGLFADGVNALLELA